MKTEDNDLAFHLIETLHKKPQFGIPESLTELTPSSIAQIPAQESLLQALHNSNEVLYGNFESNYVTNETFPMSFLHPLPSLFEESSLIGQPIKTSVESVAASTSTLTSSESLFEPPLPSQSSVEKRNNV